MKLVAASIVSLLLVACVLVVLSPSKVQPQVHSTITGDTQLDALTCQADTGGTCFTTGCSEWRKHATCSWGKCICPAGMCAHEGTCITSEELASVPPPPPVCKPVTGETCAVSSCSKASNSICSGFSIGFTELPTLGKCMCKTGQCANEQGVCEDSPQFFELQGKLENKQIVCPVLAAIWSAGYFKTDEIGRVERLDVQSGIVEGTGAAESVGFGFAQTTAGYRANDPNEQNYAMFPIGEALAEFKDSVAVAPEGQERYLNIFRMLASKDVLHQLAAAVRGGPIDPTCTGYPCAARFGRFWAQYANSDGLLCTKEFGEVAANIYKNGYHGVAADRSLFTTIGGTTFREFAALAGFLTVFGTPRNGWPSAGGDLCMTLKDARWLEMEGTFPAGWKKPAGWSADDLNPILDIWRKQGVDGMPRGLIAQSAIGSFIQKAKNIEAGGPIDVTVPEKKECDRYFC